MNVDTPVHMLAPEVQVLACSQCSEAMNANTFYPEMLDGYPNPFRGRCRNCGSVDFCVGLLKAVDAERFERRDGFKLVPFHHDLRVKDPFVTGKYFVMG